MLEQFNTNAFSHFEGLERIKRVVKFVKDGAKREYKIHLEDRDPTSIDTNK